MKGTGQARLGGKRVAEYFLDELVGVNHDYPTVDDFRKLWSELNVEEKVIVAAAVGKDLISAVARETNTMVLEVNRILNRPQVARAVYIGTISRLPTDEARHVFVNMLQASNAEMVVSVAQVEDLVCTRPSHLAEMVEQLPKMDGDGKREILNRLIAYGTQEREVASPIYDEDGKLTASGTYALADPKIALESLRELNRMDHEYGEDDVATSSIESQAERIGRLAKKADALANKQMTSIHKQVVSRVKAQMRQESSNA